MREVILGLERLSQGSGVYHGLREVIPGINWGIRVQRRSPPGPPGSFPAAAPPRKGPLAAEQDPGAALQVGWAPSLPAGMGARGAGAGL